MLCEGAKYCQSFLLQPVLFSSYQEYPGTHLHMLWSSCVSDSASVLARVNCSHGILRKLAFEANVSEAEKIGGSWPVFSSAVEVGRNSASVNGIEDVK